MLGLGTSILPRPGSRPSAAGGGAPGLPLDDVASSVFAAFGMRRLLGTYSGAALNLTRNDSATLDIGFTADGSFDEAAAEAFRVSGASGIGGTTRVNKWYDQSGAGLDVAQGNFNNMPRYDNDDGGYAVPNGKRALRCLDAQVLVRSSVAWPGGSIVGFAAVVKRSHAANNDGILGWHSGGNNGMMVAISGGSFSDWQANEFIFTANGRNSGRSPRFIGGTYATSDTDAVLHDGQLSDTAISLNKNGVAQTARVGAAGTQSIGTGDLCVGGDTDFFEQWDGILCEAVFFKGDVAASLGSYRSGAMAYWQTA